MKTLIFHMGAHRCGSTAVQSMLRRERAPLAQQNIAVALRADMLVGRFDLRRLHRYHSLNPLWRTKLKLAADQLLLMSEDALIISEENLMGTMPMVRSPHFYPHFHRLTQGLARLNKKLGPSVCLAPRLVVRRQDRYLESVYAFRVSRGYTGDFDAFLRQAGDMRGSWLRLAQHLMRLPKGVDSKIALLEAWPKGSGSANALEFLIGPHSMDMSVRRLTGNTRWSEPALRVVLAMNRANIEWRDAEWSKPLFQALEHDEAELANVIDAHLKPHLRRQQFEAFEDQSAVDATLRFSDEDRHAFLARHEDDNRMFCALPLVQGEFDLWAREPSTD